MRSVLLAAALLAPGLAYAQKLPWQTDDNSKSPQSVTYLFPEQITVAANHDAVLDLHFRIKTGLHINSHTPREKSLIATRLVVAEMPGMTIGPVSFPAGTDYTSRATPSDKLSVYSGDFVVEAHIHATPGQHMFAGALRYQACDTNSCYPPREAPIAVDVIAK